MEPLLRITRIPIHYELKINNAKLERKNGTAELEISRDKGGMHIKSRPIKVKLDTFEARNSMTPTTRTSVAQFAQAGKTAAYEATAQFAQEGQILLKAKIGEGSETLNQIFAQRARVPIGDFELAFIPKTGANINWEDSSLLIEYEMDKLSFDMKIDKGEVEFIPGDIQLEISQFPDVNIEYIGSPIYVPPSAATHFSGETIDVKA